MIDQVKKAIYRKERKQLDKELPFGEAVNKILTYHWGKSTTSLNCLTHSLNPKYYSSEWLNEDLTQVAPHKDLEITRERKSCLLRNFANEDDGRNVNIEFANFSMCMHEFGSGDAMKDRFVMEPITWWAIHGASAPSLQSIAFKLPCQPCSSSCCERNWGSYNFIHLVRRNKITPQRAEDLIFVHTIVRLLARKSSNYNEGPTQMWDVGGDDFDSLEETNLGRLEIANLSLDEPQLESVLFDEDIEDGDFDFVDEDE